VPLWDISDSNHNTLSFLSLSLGLCGTFQNQTIKLVSDPKDFYPSHNTKCIWSTSKSAQSLNNSSIAQKPKSDVSETQSKLLAVSPNKI
jgi:hypothetical protein